MFWIRNIQDSEYTEKFYMQQVVKHVRTKQFVWIKAKIQNRQIILYYWLAICSAGYK